MNIATEERFREDDGTLDEIVGNLMEATHGVDWSADDWGGIFGIMFSDVTKVETGWTREEVVMTFNEAIRIYG